MDWQAFSAIPSNLVVSPSTWMDAMARHRLYTSWLENARAVTMDSGQKPSTELPAIKKPDTEVPVPSNGDSESPTPHMLSHTTLYFLAGGLAGATSRTVVSPLERLKIIMFVLKFQPGLTSS